MELLHDRSRSGQTTRSVKPDFRIITALLGECWLIHNCLHSTVHRLGICNCKWKGPLNMGGGILPQTSSSFLLSVTFSYNSPFLPNPYVLKVDFYTAFPLSDTFEHSASTCVSRWKTTRFHENALGTLHTSGVTRNFFRVGWGGCSTNSVEDRGQRERGSGGGSPLVRGSGGRCNLVQEISFHMVKVS